MTARAASEADIPALIVLNGVVQSWHADAYPTWFKAEVPPDHLDSFFRDVLTRQDAWLWVTDSDDGPAGYLFTKLHIRDGSPITHPRRMLHIEHIVVAPEHRRAGHATALLTCAADHARALQADELTLDSWAANSEAHALFERFGLTLQRKTYSQTL